MTEYYIGLMSGTSADGVDASLIAMHSGQFCSIDQVYLPFDVIFKQQIISLYQSQVDEIEHLSQVAYLLSGLYADAITQLLKQNHLIASQIKAIGCHGQTIRHRPNSKTPFSLQIADYARLAELTEIDVIGDFRSADIAAGGQGAPLVPAFHHAIFPAQAGDQVILNIGGIANMTVLKKQATHQLQAVLGLDTGPGNGLLDEWCYLHTQKTYDHDGEWAATGQVIDELLQALLSCDYVKIKGPKSSGREVFNLTWLNQFLTDFSEYAAQDIQATLVAFTCETIQQSIIQYTQTAQVWVCGGGVHNKHLMQQLKTRLGAGFEVNSSAKINIDPDWIEADCFAWLAYCFTHRMPTNMPAVTGAKKAKVLGCLYPAS